MGRMRTFLRGTTSGRTPLAAALVATLSAAACGGGSATGSSGAGGGNSTTAAGTRGGAEGGGQPHRCTPQPADLALTGTWAAYGELQISLQGVPGGAITICPADQVGAST